MKKILLLVLIISIALSCLAGCGGKNGGKVEVPIDSRLHSDGTAKAVLPGYWTDGQSNFIYIAKSDMGLLSWQTNLPIEQCLVYTVNDGVLIGKNQGQDGELEEIPVLNLSLEGDDTLKVTCLGIGKEFTFIRDSLDVDSENINEDYIFWTMDRAAIFLDGEWMDENFNYLILSLNDDGTTNFQTSLPFDTSDGYIDFSNYEMCLIYTNDDGTKEYFPIFAFHIIDKDTIEIECKSNGKTYTMQRTTAEVDPDNTDTDYVFFCQSRAFPFLEGKWQDEKKSSYFEVTDLDGEFSWSTNFPLSEHISYTICGGRLVGLDLNDDGTIALTDIYKFSILSRDQIEITVVEKEKTYTLNRITEVE